MGPDTDQTPFTPMECSLFFFQAPHHQGRDFYFCTDVGTNNAHKVFPAEAHYPASHQSSLSLVRPWELLTSWRKRTFACEPCFISMAFHSASSETCRSLDVFDLLHTLYWKYLFKTVSLCLQMGPKWHPRVMSLNRMGIHFNSLNNSGNLTLSKRHPESQVRRNDVFPLNTQIQSTFLSIQISADKYGYNSVPNSSRQEKNLYLALGSSQIVMSFFSRMHNSLMTVC